MNRKGYYTNLSEDENRNLVITLNKKAAKEIRKEMLSNGDERQTLWVLLEDHICNSELEFVLPEEVGALTDSAILSDSAVRNDQGDLIKCDYAWWFPNYAVSNPVEELYKYGKVVFTYSE